MFSFLARNWMFFALATIFVFFLVRLYTQQTKIKTLTNDISGIVRLVGNLKTKPVRQKQSRPPISRQPTLQTIPENEIEIEPEPVLRPYVGSAPRTTEKNDDSSNLDHETNEALSQWFDSPVVGAR